MKRLPTVSMIEMENKVNKKMGSEDNNKMDGTWKALGSNNKIFESRFRMQLK